VDQVTLVKEQLDDGEALLQLLASEGFDVRVAFWAKPLDEENWFLYLSTPVVDSEGTIRAFRSIHRIIPKQRWRWLDPFDVRVLGTSDPSTIAALDIMTPKPSSQPFATPEPAPFPGTWTRRAELGELRLGGPAYIYPLPQPAPAA